MKILKGIYQNLGNKGLTIVGTLVASAIGLIVVSGTTHLLIQLTSRISQQEGRAKRPLFYTWLSGILENPTACANTLGAYKFVDPVKGEFDVAEIKDIASTGLIDFYSTAGKKRLKDEFGIDNFDKLQFRDYDSAKKEAKLVLYTKSFLHNLIPVFNKDFTLNLIGVEDNGSTPKVVTACSAAATGISAILENIKLEDSLKLTLVGGGTTTDITVADTTAYGYNAGSGDLTGDRNTFVGFETGQATTSGLANAFIGNKAGAANTTGSWNVFVGHESGKDHTTGNANVFMGNRSGYKNTTGRNNVFLGNASGIANETGNENVFVGHRSGSANETGGRNVFVGYNAGVANTTASNNTFIGTDAGSSITTGGNNIIIGHGATASNSAGDYQFIVGSGTNTNWIVGEIGTDTITINSKQVCLQGGPTCAAPSSRVYKKNIKEFKDFEKSLQDILSAPLFTYQYKENHPEKTRMGVISEELPESLQIQVEGAPSRPDWPSIYGTLWAGIKSLAKKLDSLKTEVFQETNRKMGILFQDLNAFKKEVSAKLAFFDSTLKKLETRLFTMKSQFRGFMNQLSQFKNQFTVLESRLKKAESLKAKVELLNNALVREEKVFEERQKQSQKTKNRSAENEKRLLEAQKELNASEKSLQEVQKRLTETEKQLFENQASREKQFESYDRKLKALEEKISKQVNESKISESK